MLVFTKETRNSSNIIRAQRRSSRANTLKIYDKLKGFTNDMEDSLKKGDFKKIGEIFHSHWIIKKKISKQISNSYLDKFYLKLLKDQNFVGGKIIGAGGGGFFLMITKNIKASRKFLHKRNINFTTIKFDFSGTKIIYGLK